MAGKRITDLATTTALVGDELIEASQLSAAIKVTATTISAQASDNSFNDSAAGFVAAGFAVGDRVNVTGFTGDVANNLFAAAVTDLTAGKMTIGGTDGDVIADDAAGETVTIAKWTSRRATAQDIADLGGGGGASYPSFAGNSGKVLAVNGTEDDVEWVAQSGGGGGSSPYSVPAASAFTYTHGSATVTDIPAGTLKITAPYTGSDLPKALACKSKPSGSTWDIACAYRHLNILENFAGGGIVLRDSATGDFYHFLQHFNSYADGLSIRVDKITANSTSSNVFVVGCRANFEWLRIRDDGTNVYFEVSGYGGAWNSLFSESRTAFLSGGGDQVGFGLQCWNEGGPGYNPMLEVRHFGPAPTSLI